MLTTGIPNSYYRTLQWHKLLPCVRMHSRVMCLVASVCVYYMCKKTGCLRFYRLNLSLVQFTACSLSLTATKEAYYAR